jgi:hypothetical protein
VPLYSIFFNILSDMRKISSISENVNREEKPPFRGFGKEGLASGTD